MRPTEKSCVVAFPKECNYATSALQHATTSATATQPTSLKALAGKVLARNQRCNQDATGAQQGCNFSPDNDPEKLHGFEKRNSGATTRPTLPSWCNPRCDCYHRLEVPDVGTQEAIATQRNAQWCCQEISETHWRRDRIDTMSGCPTERRQ